MNPTFRDVNFNSEEDCALLATSASPRQARGFTPLMKFLISPFLKISLVENRYATDLEEKNGHKDWRDKTDRFLMMCRNPFPAEE
jgi:hypothetical protein